MYGLIIKGISIVVTIRKGCIVKKLLDGEGVAKGSSDTAVSTKVVPQERKRSLRDNADWYCAQKELSINRPISIY